MARNAVVSDFAMEPFAGSDPVPDLRVADEATNRDDGLVGLVALQAARQVLQGGVYLVEWARGGEASQPGDFSQIAEALAQEARFQSTGQGQEREKTKRSHAQPHGFEPFCSSKFSRYQRL
jgi:hypothetical protein